MRPVSEVIKQTNLIIAAISLMLFIIIGAGKTGCVIIKDCHSPGYFERKLRGIFLLVSITYEYLRTPNMS